MPDSLTIEKMGALGDGLATHNGKLVPVPFCLPGEKVSVETRGGQNALQAVLEPSDERVEPVCQHFGTCGGCQLQHWNSRPYREWKQSLLETELKRADIEFQSEPIYIPEGKRRRAVFALKPTTKGPVLGFQERGSNQVVPLEQCPILVPEIEAEIPSIRDLLAPFALGKNGAQVTVTLTETGLDISVMSERPPNTDLLRSLTTRFSRTSYACLSHNLETICENTAPIVRFEGLDVKIPPGGFLQAIQEVEETMANMIAGHLSDCKTVADLFCGCGTFALRLAKDSQVIAAESDTHAIKALNDAWKKSGGLLKAVKSEVRDLFRRPLTAKELKKVDGVVIDPPRAGAQLQTRQIASSNVKKAAMVSCNPKTFADDLKTLLDAGFTIKTIQSLDQFRYTPHLEIVALLER